LQGCCWGGWRQQWVQGACGKRGRRRQQQRALLDTAACGRSEQQEGGLPGPLCQLLPLGCLLLWLLECRGVRRSQAGRGSRAGQSRRERGRRQPRAPTGNRSGEGGLRWQLNGPAHQPQPAPTSQPTGAKAGTGCRCRRKPALTHARRPGWRPPASLPPSPERSCAAPACGGSQTSGLSSSQARPTGSHTSSCARRQRWRRRLRSLYLEARGGGEGSAPKGRGSVAARRGIGWGLLCCDRNPTRGISRPGQVGAAGPGRGEWGAQVGCWRGVACQGLPLHLVPVPAGSLAGLAGFAGCLGMVCRRTAQERERGQAKRAFLVVVPWRHGARGLNWPIECRCLPACLSLLGLVGGQKSHTAGPSDEEGQTRGGGAQRGPSGNRWRGFQCGARAAAAGGAFGLLALAESRSTGSCCCCGRRKPAAERGGAGGIP
jgi:hypothetical protein